MVSIKSIKAFFVKLYINVSNRWLGSPESLSLTLKVILSCCVDSEVRQILITLGLRGQDLSRLLLRSSSHACGSGEVVREIARLEVWVEVEPVGVRVVVITRGEFLVLDHA